MKPPMLVSGACKILEVTQPTVHALVASGKLAATRLENGYLLFQREDVERVKEERAAARRDRKTRRA